MMGRNYQVMALIFAILMLPLLYIHTNGFNLTDYIALRGFSALELIVRHAHPANFVHDFPDGTEAARASISSLAYLWSGAATPEDALPLYYLMFSLDIATSLAGALYLFFTLVKLAGGDISGTGIRSDSRIIAAAVITGLLFTASYAQSANLARFSTPFYHGQFYGFADGLRLLAIAFALQGRWALVPVVLCGAFLFHPVKAAWGALFLMPCALLSFRQIFRPVPLVAGVLAVGVGAAWVLTVLPETPAGESISDLTFYLYSRANQFHWYPLDMGILDKAAHSYLLPFSAAILAGLVAGVRMSLPRRVASALLYGSLLLVVVTALGLYFSTLVMPSALVRLSPLRASEVVIAIAVVVICAGATRRLVERQYLEAALMAGVLAGTFTARSGLSELLALLLAGLFLWRHGNVTSGAWRIVAAAAMINAGILAWQLVSGNVGFKHLIDLPALVPLAVLAIAAVLARFLRWKRSAAEDAAMIVLAVSAVIGAVVWGGTARTMSDALASRAGQYHKVQLWARQNTPADALFLVDPCTTYGWREFSMRSSIGTPAEWYMNGWLYGLHKDVFERGQKIGRSIGVPVEDYLSQPGQKRGHHRRQICSAVQAIVHDPASGALDRLATDHGVEYFVALNEKSKALLQSGTYGIVFANDDYSVLKLLRRRPAEIPDNIRNEEKP
jgi:hypothetical protein